MSYARILSRLRKESGNTQREAAEYISKRSGKPYSYKMVSHWENGVSLPPVEQFLLLCELYGVNDIQATFRGLADQYTGSAKLNALGRSRVEEYVSMLSGNALFAEPAEDEYSGWKARRIKLYDVPVAAGFGEYLDSGACEDLETDETVPKEADFAVKISGDSMEPRFVDKQIVFVQRRQTLNIGDIGIFELAGDAYIKKLGHGCLLSLNPRYDPIPIHTYDSFHIFGKVVG